MDIPPPPPPAPGTPPPPPPSVAPAIPPRRGWWSRNWKWFVPTGCFSLLVLFALFAVGITMFVFSVIKQSDVYKAAVLRAENDQRVQDALGTPMKTGWFVTGKTNAEGASGEANLAIPISGPKAKGTIYAVATKSGGDDWDYSKLSVKVDGSDDEIDIASEKDD